MTQAKSEAKTSMSWPAVVAMAVVPVVAALALWQLFGSGGPSATDRLSVTGPPAIQASGGEPTPWIVSISPGEEGQLCAHGAFGQSAEDRTGQQCSVVVRPDAAGNDLFGSGGSMTHEGRTLVWGLVDPDVTQVEVELVDGSTEIATVAGGAMPNDPDARVALWAFATDGEVEATVARTEDGTEERLESSPLPVEN